MVNLRNSFEVWIKYFNFLFWSIKEYWKSISMASSSYSPLASILKSSSLNVSNKKLAQPLQVRFDSLVTIDVASILKDYLEGRSDVKYSQLLNLKNDPHVNVSKFNMKTRALKINFIVLGCIFTFDSSTSQQYHQPSCSQSWKLCLCTAKHIVDNKTTSSTWWIFKFCPDTSLSTHILLQTCSEDANLKFKIKSRLWNGN